MVTLGERVGNLQGELWAFGMEAHSSALVAETFAPMPNVLHICTHRLRVSREYPSEKLGIGNSFAEDARH